MIRSSIATACDFVYSLQYYERGSVDRYEPQNVFRISMSFVVLSGEAREHVYEARQEEFRIFILASMPDNRDDIGM